MKGKRNCLAMAAVLAFFGGMSVRADQAGLAEQMIYDKDGLKVTVTGLEESYMGEEVKLQIENDSEQKLGIQARDVSVNGYMVPSMMSVEVAPGKKANDSLTILTDDFEAMGIDTVAEIELSLNIFDPDSWLTVATSEPVSLVTEGNEAYEQVYDDSGEVLYDSDDVKVVYKGFSEDSLMGPEFQVYAENKSDRDIVLQVGDASVNDFMMNAIFSVELPAGKRAFDGIAFLSSEIEENGIEQIQKAEVSFRVSDRDSWQMLDETDVIELLVE